MFALFLKGLIIGSAIAAPVGPIGILCIKRSLHLGFQIGFMTGVGAALAHGTYGLIAAFGLTAITKLLVTEQLWLRLIGGVFLIYIGIKLSMMPAQERSTAKNSIHTPLRAGISAYFLTLTNPMTILSFMAVFAGLGLGSAHPDYVHALMLVVGICTGSALWWLFLSASVAYILRQRVTPYTLRLINRCSGIVIITFGVFALKAAFNL